MTDPPLDPKDAVAALATELADTMADVLLGLVRGGYITEERLMGIVMAHLAHPPSGRVAIARQLLLEQVLRRLAGAPPGSGRA